MSNKFFLMIISFLPLLDYAQPAKINMMHSRRGEVRISGRIIGGRSGMDTVAIIFTKDFLLHNLGATIVQKQTDSNGYFSFTFPTIDHPAKLTFLFYVSPKENLEDYVAEPGDNIYITLTKSAGDNVYAFSGKRSIKYAVRRKTEVAVRWWVYHRVDSVTNFDLYNSLGNAANAFQDFQKGAGRIMQILKKDKKNISPEAYQLMGADLIGQLQMNWQETLRTKYIEASNEHDKNWATHLLSTYKPALANTNGSVLALSEKYIRYTVAKAQTELYIKSKGQKYGIRLLYNKLKSDYRGPFRDKLLTYCLLEHDEVKYQLINDSDATAACIADACHTIKTPYIVKVIRKMNRLTRGSAVFNFSLPDTSGKLVSAKSLLGKVYLLDIWGTGCSGCAEFSEMFDSLVLPKYKDDTSFKIVSICCDKDKKRWLKSLYSERYTRREFNNLYTSGLGINHPIFSYYNIQGIPFILVVDKRGKVFANITS